MIDSLVASAIIAGARILTGVQARWVGCGPKDVRRIYFANHTSHLDFILVWSALPKQLRERTRPVAAADYWEKGAMRRYLIHRVFRGILVERGRISRESNPIAPMLEALDRGESLILFPEGTRGSGEELGTFKSGIFHVAQGRRDVELVPVWIQNSYRVMPKGMPLPIPLLCSVAFGKPLSLAADEHKPDFLDRLREAMIELEDA